jgi:hypothetical protein
MSIYSDICKINSDERNLLLFYSYCYTYSHFNEYVPTVYMCSADMFSSPDDERLWSKHVLRRKN